MLYERGRSVSSSEKRAFLQADLMAKRVPREESMPLSHKLGAFVHTGLPLIEAVYTLGAPAGKEQPGVAPWPDRDTSSATGAPTAREAFR